MKYKVEVPFVCWVIVEVEADSEDEAIEEGIEQAYIDSYMGNGGIDKLIGVCEEHMSIEAGEDMYTDENLKVKVEEAGEEE